MAKKSLKVKEEKHPKFNKIEKKFDWTSFYFMSVFCEDK